MANQIPTCQHDRLEDVCEYCQHARAVAAGVPVGPINHRATPEAEPIADRDHLVEIGDHLHVYVAKGTVVPAELADRTPKRKR